MALTFGEGVGIVVAVLVPIAGLCVALWRCCCGDDNFWRTVDYCKGKDSVDSGSPGTDTHRTTIKTRTCDQSCCYKCLNCCHSCQCCSVVNIQNSKEPSNQPSANDTDEEASVDVISQQPLPAQTANNSQPMVDPTLSNQTAVPSAPPEETQPVNETTSLLTQQQPTSNSQPTVDPTVSNQTAVPSAPPEDTQTVNETTSLLTQQPPTDGNPCTTNETARSAPPATQNGETTSIQHCDAVRSADNEPVSITTTVDVHQTDAPQSNVTSGHSSAVTDQIYSNAIPVSSHQPQQENAATTVDPEADVSLTRFDQPLLHSTVAAKVDTKANGSQTDFSQLRQQSANLDSMSSSSLSPSGAGGHTESLPAMKEPFSAKFVRELGKLLNPESSVEYDWRLILVELWQPQGEVNHVASMRDPTAEALRRWQEAGRSLDDLSEVFKMKRPDVIQVIESCMKNNDVISGRFSAVTDQIDSTAIPISLHRPQQESAEAATVHQYADVSLTRSYQPLPHSIDVCAAIPVETVSRMQRLKQTIVTKDQLCELADNLADWHGLAFNLGLSKGDIYKLEQGNKYSEWNQVYYMLAKWKDRNYNNATVGLLVEACRKTSTVDTEMYAFLLD